MRPAPFSPQHQLFVCTNARAEDDPLGPGCAAHGVPLYHALKAEVGRRRLLAQVWISRSLCLGLCPRQGAALALAPSGRLWVDVTAADVAELWHNAQLP